MNKRKDYIAFWLIFGIFIIFTITIVLSANGNRKINYYAYANTLDLAEIIDANQLTYKAIENRNGKLIIEKCIGVVEDAATGKGYVIDDHNYYISYANVQGISNGNVICSYFIYNPDTNYVDDILYRFDYIIDNGNILE